ncbi:MFS family permease [Natronospira proteinivora]|uniref:MFS family permease n=1 Tax=Natronospira proteinivora TaxID=1807133 RepID=A0ABT1G7L4_9GAMM|nr:MFS transporter [Natronospira proteinivora]MCP1727284.1 MFS family permease [Natronospira proteinivora]
MSGKGLWPIGLAIYLLMLPVTGVVPVLEELTGGRHPQLSDFDKHLFMVANMAAAVVLAPLAGRLSDHLGRRQPIIVGVMLANALVLVLLANDASYWTHLLLRFFDGALHITALTLLMTMAMDRARLASTGRAMGVAGASLTLGVATGAPLGGLIGQGEAIHVLYAGAGLSLVLALWVSGLEEAPHRPLRSNDERAPVRKLPWRALLLPYVFTFADRLSVGFIISTMVLYMRTVLAAEPNQIGALMGSFMLPFALLTYVFGRLAKRFRPLPMMMSGSALYGLALLALALAPLPLWWLLMPLGGVAAALMFAPSLVLTAQAAGEDNRAMAMGGFHAAGSLGFLLGPLVGGGTLALAGWLGYSGWLAAFLLMSALQWLCVLLFLPRLLRERGIDPHQPSSASPMP